MASPTAADWKRKVDALLRLAEDQRGKPEGDLAREKIKEILARHPEARQYEPVQKFMMSDLKYMRMAGISTDGRWTGADLEEAIAIMTADYRRRIEEHEKRQRRLEAGR